MWHVHSLYISEVVQWYAVCRVVQTRISFVILHVVSKDSDFSRAVCATRVRYICRVLRHVMMIRKLLLRSDVTNNLHTSRHWTLIVVVAAVVLVVVHKKVAAGVQISKVISMYYDLPCSPPPC